MLRNTKRVNRREGRTGKTSPVIPAAVVATLFTVVAVTVLVLTNRSGADHQKQVTKNHQQSPPATPSRNEQKNGAGERSTRSTTLSRTATKGTLPVETESARGTKEPANSLESRRRRVAGHLAAGEFGAALALASKVSDPAEKSALLKHIAQAQWKAGETEAAGRTLRGIPLEADRRQASREQVQRWVSAAGGSGADFTQLKKLIMDETSGPWFEVEGVGGTMTELETGVRVDPAGMLSRLTREELTGRLKALGIRARQAELNDDMARRSALRLVSLTRLEREIRRRIAAGESAVETMKNLAGLYKVEYVFVYPASGEIVIGGPAEGWKYDAQGQPVSLTESKPTLQLDDFVTVFRTFSPEGDGFFNCLIVPRAEGLKKARAVSEASQKRGPLSPGGTRNFVRQLTNALGLQDVKVNGVPAESRVARVIVEADYRMKLIGIDKLDAGPGIPSYFDLLAKNPQKNPPALDALRWWLTMKYDAILHSKDRTVFHIQGSSVLCQGLNEKITPDGRRVHTGQADPVNRLFAVNFTNHYAELARRDPIFADLQNIFDLSLVAALIRHERLDRASGWEGGLFAGGGEYHPAVWEAPRSVMSVSNFRRYGGNSVVIQVAGGVRGDLMAVVRDPRLHREMPRLGSLRDYAQAPELPAGRWWWDVKADAVK